MTKFELIDKNALIRKFCSECQHCYRVDKAGGEPTMCKTVMMIAEMPTIEPEVRHGKGCSYCKGRSYTKKPLTVITRTMKRVEVCFNFCPNCGRDMRATETNVCGNGGADNG